MQAKKLELECISTSAEETEQIGQRLAQRLHPGDVVGVYGDLGAGKTCLVRGLAQGLGSSVPVHSPTFALVHEYAGGRCPLYHFDAYRLSSAVELYDLGWEEYCGLDGICVLEWAQKVQSALPRRHWQVHLDIQGDDSRQIRVEHLLGCKETA